MRTLPAGPIRLAAVAVLTAAGVFVLPGPAAAGCGDYATVDTGTTAISHDAPPAPCDGPGCSSRPTAPAPPLTAPATNPVNQDPAAVAVDRPVAPAIRSTPATRDDSAGRSIHVPQPVYHPPRGM